MNRIRREPALFVGLVEALLQLVISLFGLPPEWQACLNALVVASGGFAVATWVVKEGQVPALLGLMKAVLAVAVGLGLRLDDSQQALLMAVVSALAAFFIRNTVVAPVDKNLNPV